MIIDTHCHLNFKAFSSDCDAVLDQMRKQNVRAIVVGSQSTTSARAVELARSNLDILRAAVALHPLHLYTRHITREEVEHPFTTRAERFDEMYYRELASDPSVVAIGECGLDYFSKPEGFDEDVYKRTQQDVFKRHIALAQSLKFPLIIHTRSHPSNYFDAHEDALSILEEVGYDRVVWHAFATHPKTAEKILRKGYKVSFTGLIADPRFKEILADIVRKTPLERMMIETDAPYMVVSESNDLRNTPLGVLDVARYIAQYKNIDVEEVISATTQNALAFFKIKDWLTR